jgi:hypothetical protein
MIKLGMSTNFEPGEQLAWITTKGTHRIINYGRFLNRDWRGRVRMTGVYEGSEVDLKVGDIVTWLPNNHIGIIRQIIKDCNRPRRFMIQLPEEGTPQMFYEGPHMPSIIKYHTPDILSKAMMRANGPPGTLGGLPPESKAKIIELAGLGNATKYYKLAVPDLVKNETGKLVPGTPHPNVLHRTAFSSSASTPSAKASSCTISRKSSRRRSNKTRRSTRRTQRTKQNRY